MTMMKSMASLFVLACSMCGCTLGAFAKQYWRIDTLQEDGDWETNWTIWFETETDCLAEIQSDQRCMARRM